MSSIITPHLFPSLLTLSSGILAGSNIAISLVSVPAIMATSDPLPAWRETYNNGKNIALTCIAGNLVTSIKCFYDSMANSGDGGGGDTTYLAVSLSSFGIVVYTLWLMKPVNDSLFAIKDDEKERADPRIRSIVRNWAGLHWVRTGLSVGAFLTTIWIRYNN